MGDNSPRCGFGCMIGRGVVLDGGGIFHAAAEEGARRQSLQVGIDSLGSGPVGVGVEVGDDVDVRWKGGAGWRCWWKMRWSRPRAVCLAR